MEEEVRIFTSIKSDYYRRSLFMGLLIALCGLGVLFYLGSYVTQANVFYLGLPILILGIFLIVWGLVPLRYLSKLEQNPNELIATRKDLHYVVKGQPLFTVPVDSLSEICFIEETSRYGIGLFLKDKSGKSIIVHNPKFDPSNFIKKSQKEGADLFLPFFQRRAFSRIGFIKHPPE